MPVPPPNSTLGPDGLPLVRFYTKDDPVYADVDNRPLSDLAERDRKLQSDFSIASGYLAAKVGEDTTTPPSPAGPPFYAGPQYVVQTGESHNKALTDLDTEAQKVQLFIGKDDAIQTYPVFSTKGGPQYAVLDSTPLANAIAGLDAEVKREMQFVGKDSLAQSAPIYSTKGAPLYSVLDTDNIATAVAKLDAEANREHLFVGKDSLVQVAPIYSTKGAPEYAILDTQPLANALARADAELNRIKTFLGKDSLIQVYPDYSLFTTFNFIAPNDPIRNAVGKLDAALAARLHNSLLGLQGGSLAERYHATANQSSALDGIPGHAPTPANPIATKSYVDLLSAAQITKIAWGYTARMHGLTGNISTDVNFSTGALGGDTHYAAYYGDVGFTSIKCRFYAVAAQRVWDNHADGYISGPSLVSGVKYRYYLGGNNSGCDIAEGSGFRGAFLTLGS